MKKFHIIRDPYEEGVNIYNKANIEIKEGLTILVGCNGSGKTTLLRTLEGQLRKENIPVLLYDNTQQDSSASKRDALLCGDLSILATSMTSSEGENIIINMGCVAKDIGMFVRNNGKKEDKLAKLFRNTSDSEEEDIEAKEFWIFFDAIDSGLSIDNVLDMKEYLFKTIINDVTNRGKKIYIIVSANEYEMCCGEQCFDVQKGEYVEINSYEDFRNIVIKSRKKKDKITNSK